jgi:hypothetical protein
MIERRCLGSARFPNQTSESERCKNNNGGREASSRRAYTFSSFNHRNHMNAGGTWLLGMKGGRFGGRATFFIDWSGAKLGYVGSGREVDPKFVLVSRIVVILSNPLAYLPGCYADYRIVAAVVVRSPTEDFDPEGSLFEGIFLPFKRLLDDIPEEWRISFALSEQRACQYPLKLILDQSAFLRTQGRSSGHLIFGYRHRCAFFKGSIQACKSRRLQPLGTQVSYGPPLAHLANRK